MKHDCIIGLGSNIDPEHNIAAALFFIRSDHKLVSISGMVQTAPIGIVEQPDFTNGAARVTTNMELADFRNYLKIIEDQLNRDRTLPKYGPRTIDLDIVVWDGEIIDKDYDERDFLRRVVAEIYTFK